MPYARTSGLVFSAIIGAAPARRLDKAQFAGFYSISRFLNNRLVDNPLTIRVLLQPSTAPAVGDVVYFPITVSLQANDAATSFTVFSAFYVFTTTTTNPRSAFLTLAGGSVELIPAGTADAGSWIGMLIRRNGPNVLDTYAGNISLGETVNFVFTNEFA
jgi:hypothetical protein